MKTIIKSEEVTYYITEDNTSFTLLSRAEDHERYINDSRIAKEISKMELKVPLLFSDVLDGIWYLAGNDEQIKYLLRKYTNKNNYDYVNESERATIQRGDWVAIVYERNRDGEREEDGLVTLEYVITQMNKFIKNAEKQTVKGKY